MYSYAYRLSYVYNLCPLIPWFFIERASNATLKLWQFLSFIEMAEGVPEVISTHIRSSVNHQNNAESMLLFEGTFWFIIF